jgi:pimeloyl-ACP methyl ester carboxylesterase
MTADTVGDRYFLSGLYTGELRAGRIIVDSGDGPLAATVVRLPGTPGWGAWYADLPLHENLSIHRVTLYDERGREIAFMKPARP